MVMRVSSTARSNFSGVPLKPGASPYIRTGMASSATTVSSQDHEHQAGKRLLREGAGGFLALALQPLGEQGHERRVEGALAKQPAEQIGKAERHEEGVGHGTGAQHGSNQNIADEAEHAAEHGQAADGGEGAVKPHGGRGVAEPEPRARHAR